METDYYKLLGIAPNSSQADVEFALTEQLSIIERLPALDRPEPMRQIAEAFVVLLDAEKRERYDRRNGFYVEPRPDVELQQIERDKITSQTQRNLWCPNCSAELGNDGLCVHCDRPAPTPSTATAAPATANCSQCGNSFQTSELVQSSAGKVFCEQCSPGLFKDKRAQREAERIRQEAESLLLKQEAEIAWQEKTKREAETEHQNRELRQQEMERQRQSHQASPEYKKTKKLITLWGCGFVTFAIATALWKPLGYLFLVWVVYAITCDKIWPNQPKTLADKWRSWTVDIATLWAAGWMLPIWASLDTNNPIEPFGRPGFWPCCAFFALNFGGAFIVVGLLLGAFMVIYKQLKS